MSEDLEQKLRDWADQAKPVTGDEARERADAGDIVPLGPTGAGGWAARPRRLLAVAASVVLVGAVALGGWAITNDERDATDVDTVDQVGTSTTSDPVTTLATTSIPATTTTPDATTTPGPDAVQAPDLIVVHSADHRLEVRRGGETVRVLAQFDDPDAEVPDGDGAGMGRYLGPFVVSPDGQTVYYETCCEPASGEVFRVPITGGEPELVTSGTSPAVSPDGTKLAVIELQDLLVIDLADGSEQRYRLADGEGVVLLANPSWSPDGTRLALERYDVSLDDGRVVVVTVDGTDGALQQAVTVARTDANGIPMHPVFDQAGAIVVIRQLPALDASQGARSETYRSSGDTRLIEAVSLDQPVLSQRTAGGGRFLLRTLADGTLVADLGDRTVAIPGTGLLDAAW